MSVPVEPPQVHHPTGHRKIDFAVPVAALFVSLVSILIAWYSASVEADMARQNERMVQASSLPHVSQAINTINRSSGLNHVTFSIANEGVGPAEIRSTAISVRGSPVRSPEELLGRYDIPGGHLSIAALTNVMLRPGQQLEYFDLDADPSIAAKVDRMIDDIENRRISVHICYCSVFDECWTIDAPNVRPQRVANCPTVHVPYE
jgi:hypothetical protein